MEIIITDHYKKLSKRAAEIVAEQIRKNKETTLGLATGSTPEGLYSCLVRMYRVNRLDFSTVVTFNLDEYIGLSLSHPQSYSYYMHKHLFDHVNLEAGNINLPYCNAQDSYTTCLEYEQKIKAAGGIDLQVLGIGTNGHIGFNEPGDSLYTETHVANLSEETIEANSRFFQTRQEVPKQAITMGVGSILGAKKILLLASGSSKARAVQGMCSGVVTTALPASLLQLHPNVTVILDLEAASLIKK